MPPKTLPDPDPGTRISEGRESDEPRNSKDQDSSPRNSSASTTPKSTSGISPTRNRSKTGGRVRASIFQATNDLGNR
ncbi:hypothetical protein TrLO_g10750 [Triparma laevis f. longispina]|uniref:Uncharacterized protein n=1 Tax=Triparma laevis f. longispina TaxID=1714387 RepID=A0A9W6ZNW9_9STRA|nr:hypothetical protein TrLO_g10750 [Triparma laevis f. longispina]